MIYKKFKNIMVSNLGFGTMRLPVMDNNEIDEEKFEQMIDFAIEKGINYFDTAWPYHAGKSEIALAKALKKYSRDRYYIADKYPGHQISENYNPEEIFLEQLKKCEVDFFDFYLLHNVYENSMNVYLDPKYNIIEYFKEQKRCGKIKYLGFSTHGSVDNLREFLDIESDFDFCQIQLNWLDWTLQDAKAKVELLNERNIPIIVMEPVRGGRLCNLNSNDTLSLKSKAPDKSIASWSFRFLQDIPGVTVILSGMSNLEQMQDNIKTFETEDYLSIDDKKMLLEMAEQMQDSIPCTSCRYCTSECLVGLDIPMLINVYNEIKLIPTTNAIMKLDALSNDKQPNACKKCAQCQKMCPQHIDIPKVLTDLTNKLEEIPKWKDICKVREEEAKKLKNNSML